MVARYYDADYTLIAHSGRGAARNYGDIGTRVEGYDERPDVEYL
jgi:hypothetical protein